jgi:tetratricopeptide (TPR) repeat protein
LPFEIRSLLLLLCAAPGCLAQQTEAEKLIDAGHWKRARTIVEARIKEAPNGPLANFLLSQVHNAFGDHNTPLGLAEKAVALDPRTAKYHRQIAECLGVMAQHAGAFQQLLLARRFRKEIDSALALDPRDTQALRDLMEFYLLAPGLLGGDTRKAEETAGRIARLDAAEGFLAKARIAESRKQTVETEAWLRKAAEAQPPKYRARIALADFYLAPEHANPGGAETQAKQAIQLDPGRSAGYCVLAQLYADRADWSALDAILTVAAREVPDDWSPYYRAAERLAASGRDAARAERYVQLYASQEPEGNQPSAAAARGLVYSTRPSLVNFQNWPL